MATRPTSVKEDFLKCRICLEIFTDPRILTCLHTYCFRCLKSRCDKAKSRGPPAACCPECHEPLPDDVNSLPTNVFASGLAEVKRVNTSSQSAECTACQLQGKNSEAEVMCLDCGDHLCSSCSDGHNSSSMTWTHVKVALAELRKGAYYEKLRDLYMVKCHEHRDQSGEYYCEECSELVCISCMLRSHRKHKYLPVSEAAVERKSNMTTAVVSLQRNMADIVSEEKQVKYDIDSFTTQKRKEKEKIELAAALKISEINRQKSSDLAVLASEAKRVQSQKSAKLEAVRLKKGRLSGCLSLCETILEHGREGELVVTETIIRSKLDQLACRNSAVPQPPQIDVLEAENSRKESETEPNKCRVFSDAASSESTQLKVPEVEHDRKELQIEPDKGRNTLEAVSSASYVTASSGEPFKAKQGTSIANVSRTKGNEGVLSSKQTVVNFKKPGNISRLLLKFTAKYTNDKDTPDMKAIVFSSNIGLIMADSRNNKLKIFKTSGEPTHEIQMKGFKPLSVAVVCNVIGSISANYLWLFYPSGTLNTKVKVTDINPEKPFRLSLAGSKSIGFVVGQPWKKGLFVFNTKGERIKTLTFSIYFPLVSLSVSPSGSFVLGEWGGSGIGIISEEGKRKHAVHYKNWKPNGTCVNCDGNIFIADYNWGGVYVYSDDGHLLQEYDTMFDGLQNPTCLTVDDNSQVYVVDKQGAVFVYKITTKK